MAKEKQNKWTRERSFWELNGPDIMMLVTAAFFLVLTVVGIGFFLLQPQVRGLHELFSDPPPAIPTGPPPNQTLHLAPGETTINIPPKKQPEQKKP